MTDTNHYPPGTDPAEMRVPLDIEERKKQFADQVDRNASEPKSEGADVETGDISTKCLITSELLGPDETIAMMVAPMIRKLRQSELFRVGEGFEVIVRTKRNLFGERDAVIPEDR